MSTILASQLFPLLLSVCAFCLHLKFHQRKKNKVHNCDLAVTFWNSFNRLIPVKTDKSQHGLDFSSFWWCYNGRFTKCIWNGIILITSYDNMHAIEFMAYIERGEERNMWLIEVIHLKKILRRWHSVIDRFLLEMSGMLQLPCLSAAVVFNWNSCT